MDLMKKISTTLFALLVLLGGTTYAQEITGLSGFTIFLDQGHSQTENMGLYNYSEAEKVLRVGLALRDLLLNLTDIDTVYTARTTDSDQISLSQRTALANSLGVDFYYSIHSDAGGASANSTLFMYGGWRQNGVTIEKNPTGGKDFSNIMEEILPDAMRTNSRGVYADRTFYQGFPTNHTNTWPYLHVNRVSNMASMLSEAGFHTNPFQQQRNMNAEYKRLEAYSAFWVILEYLGVVRPNVSILTGNVSNTEGGKKLNGASISVDGQTYVTDTYESLFNQYSGNPDQLANGFFFFEDLTPGTHEVIATAPDFYPDTVEVTLSDTFFTFQDFSLISNRAPFVASSFPEDGDTTLYPGQDIVLTFNRGMNQTSVDTVLTIVPEVENLSFSWTSSNQLTISTDNFDFLTNYTLTIDSTARDNSPFEHLLDGNNDGTPGGDFELSFKTNRFDVIAPEVVDVYPTNTKLNELHPILNVTFSEEIDTSSLGDTPISLLNSDITGQTVHYLVGDKSVISFFPDWRLEPNRNYNMSISGTIGDSLGNTLGSNVVRGFPTANEEPNIITSIDNFDNGLNNWWLPAQSDSTTGIVAELTDRFVDTAKVNLIFGSTGSLRVNYGWDDGVSDHFIRQYTPRTSPKFNTSNEIHAFVFGDGSGNQFRFMARDGNGELEGSKWYTVDWLGWRLITWDLDEDDIVGWVNGDSVLNGNAHFDSFQLTHVPGQATTGFLVFDDLRVVVMGLPVSNEDDDEINLPTKITLDQNYPNPFNPSTTIQFGLPNRSNVRIDLYDMLGRKVDTIFEGTKGPGIHTINYDASALASGMYIYRLVTSNTAIAKKMMLIK